MQSQEQYLSELVYFIFIDLQQKEENLANFEGLVRSWTWEKNPQVPLREQCNPYCILNRIFIS